MTTGEGAVGPGWQRLGAAGLQARALRIQRADVAFFKHIFESYEEVGMVRTVETRPDATVLIAVLAVDDYVHVAQAVVWNQKAATQWSAGDRGSRSGFQ